MHSIPCDILITVRLETNIIFLFGSYHNLKIGANSEKDGWNDIHSFHFLPPLFNRDEEYQNMLSHLENSRGLFTNLCYCNEKTSFCNGCIWNK